MIQDVPQICFLITIEPVLGRLFILRTATKPLRCKHYKALWLQLVTCDFKGWKKKLDFLQKKFDAS